MAFLLSSIDHTCTGLCKVEGKTSSSSSCPPFRPTRWQIEITALVVLIFPHGDKKDARSHLPWSRQDEILPAGCSWRVVLVWGYVRPKQGVWLEFIYCQCPHTSDFQRRRRGGPGWPQLPVLPGRAGRPRRRRRHFPPGEGAVPALGCQLEPVAAGSALTGAAGALGAVSARDWGYCRRIPDCRLTACLGGTGEEGEGRGGCASL